MRRTSKVSPKLNKKLSKLSMKDLIGSFTEAFGVGEPPKSDEASPEEQTQEKACAAE